MNLLQLNLEKSKIANQKSKRKSKTHTERKNECCCCCFDKGNQYLFGVKTAKTKKTC